MKNILTIMRKELRRVFGDRRLILSVFILPGLMIYLLYSLMGTAMQNLGTEAEGKTAKVYASNTPVEIIALFDTEELAFNYELVEADLNKLDEYKEAILDEEIDYLIIFPSDFLSKIANKESPDVEVYYNPVSEVSALTNSKIMVALSIFRNAIISNELGEIFTLSEQQIMNEDKALGKGFAMMLPLLIITFLFSGVMAIGPESISGEKERSTLATLLATPVKRNEIALGKIFSLTISCIVSAASSFIGIIASLPKLLGMQGEVVSSTNIYGFAEYTYLFLVVLATSLVLIGLVSIISAYAKNVKEASIFAMPLMILSMLVSISAMFSTSANANWYMYFIPLYNSVQTMVGLFSFEFDALHFAITISSNLAFVGLTTIILTRMFHNERIMFSK